MNRYETIYDRTLEWAYGLNDCKPLNTVDVWRGTMSYGTHEYRVVVNAHPEYKWIGDPKQHVGPFEMIVYPSSKLVASFAPIIIASPNGISLLQREGARRFSRILDKTMQGG